MFWVFFSLFVLFLLQLGFVVVERPIWMEDKCNHFKRQSVSQNLQTDLFLFGINLFNKLVSIV